MLYYDIEKETICMKFIYPAVFRKTENAIMPSSRILNAARLPATLWTTLSKMQMKACRNWITVELEEEEPNMPYVSDIEDIEIKDGDIVRNISVNIQFL